MEWLLGTDVEGGVGVAVGSTSREWAGNEEESTQVAGATQHNERLVYIFTWIKYFKLCLAEQNILFSRV